MPDELQQVMIGLGIIAGSVILSLLAGFILKIVSVRFSRRTATSLDDVILDSVTGPLRVAIIVAGVQIAVSQFGVIQETWRKPISDFFWVVYLLIIYVAVYRLTAEFREWAPEARHPPAVVQCPSHSGGMMDGSGAVSFTIHLTIRRTGSMASCGVANASPAPPA